MVNRVRGEVEFIINGKKYRAALTMTAIAEVLDAYGLKGLDQIGDIFPDGHLDIRTIIKVVTIVINANVEGDADKVDEKLVGSINIIDQFLPLYQEFKHLFPKAEAGPTKAAEKVSPGKA